MLGERQRNIPRHEQRYRTCNRRISIISQFGRFFRTGSHCNRTQWIDRNRHYLRRYNFPNDKRRTTDNGLPRHTQHRIYVFQSHRPPGHIFPTVFVPTVRLQWISKNRLRLGISFQKNHHGITFDAAYTALHLHIHDRRYKFDLGRLMRPRKTRMPHPSSFTGYLSRDVFIVWIQTQPLHKPLLRNRW